MAWRAFAAKSSSPRAARTAATAVAAAGIAAQRDPHRTSSLGLLTAEAADTPVGRLSQGQQARLHLAMVLIERPHVLLLDEPTNHLSPALVDEMTEALQVTEQAVVVVTHDRQMLRDLSDWPRLELTAEAVAR